MDSRVVMGLWIASVAVSVAAELPQGPYQTSIMLALCDSVSCFTSALYSSSTSSATLKLLLPARLSQTSTVCPCVAKKNVLVQYVL